MSSNNKQVEIAKTPTHYELEIHDVESAEDVTDPTDQTEEAKDNGETD